MGYYIESEGEREVRLYNESARSYETNSNTKILRDQLIIHLYLDHKLGIRIISKRFNLKMKKVKEIIKEYNA